MKTNYLLPNQFKKIGWFLLFPGVTLGLIFLITHFEPNFLYIKLFALADEPLMSGTSFFTVTDTNVIDEIIGLLLIIGSILIEP